MHAHADRSLEGQGHQDPLEPAVAADRETDDRGQEHAGHLSRAKAQWQHRGHPDPIPEDREAPAARQGWTDRGVSEIRLALDLFHPEVTLGQNQLGQLERDQDG